MLIKHLLEQAKKADLYFSEEEIKGREDVILCMKDKWDRQRELEREIEGKKKPTPSGTRALGYRLKD